MEIGGVGVYRGRSRSVQGGEAGGGSGAGRGGGGVARDGGTAESRESSGSGRRDGREWLGTAGRRDGREQRAESEVESREQRGRSRA
uniref:Uncharacterized protein n=1 Tax=Fagus sylvatica TaxID=28930 RepID=A0A2N9G3T4_FAGSY